MLTRRFFLYLLLPLLALLVALGSTFYVVTKDHLQRQIDVNLRANAKAIDRSISGRLESIRNDLATMRTYPALSQYYQFKAFDEQVLAHDNLLLLERGLASVASLKPLFQSVRFFDKSGDALISIVNGERGYLEKDEADDAWFARTLTLAKGESSVSGVGLSAIDKCPRITVSAPTHVGGELAGVFAVDICVADLTGELIAEHEPAGGYVYIVSEAGQVLAKTANAPSPNDVSGLFTTSRIVEGFAGEASMEVGSELVREAYRPQAATSLGIVVGIPHSVVFAPVHEMRETMIPRTVLGFLLVAVLGLIAVRRTVRPIRQLTQAAGEIAQGSLEKTLDIRTGDEVQELASSFNRMTSSLRSALDSARTSAEVEERRATELAKAYDELKTAQKQLVQAEKMGALGQLAGGVAHDFNNLLSGIMSSADLLKRVELEPNEQVAYLDTIVETSRRAADLIGQLLVFSRAGPAQAVRVDLHTIVREAGAILRRTIDRRITIEERLDADEPVVIGDPSQLQSAFLNLCVNARDAMPDGGQLTLATRTLDLDAAYCMALPEPIEPGRYVEVSVTDTGHGMEPDVVARVFEPFFTTKEVGKGTGLGLSAVYGTTRSHGGAVNVYSEPGEGTIFRVYLPLDTSGAPAWQKPQPATVVRGSGRILFVDDEPVIRSVGTDMLEWLGYRVITADDGEEALQRFRAEHGAIDLVIADLVMPKMNGRDLLRELKLLEPDLPVLIASGFLPNVKAHELLEEGADDVLQKPYVVAELSRRVASALAKETHAGPLDVMVVDDTAVNRQAVGALLESLGHSVERFANAEDALARLAESRFDVLLMDIGLPGMSGTEATTRIRAERSSLDPRLPIIAMTGQNSEGDRDVCLRAGMDDFLAKPIDMDSLRGVLDRVLRTRGGGVDWAEVRRALGGQDELLSEVAQAFLDESPALMKSLHEAIQRRDADEIARVAHALKGSMLYFEGHSAASHARALEKQTKGGEIDGAEAIAATLDEAYRSLRKETTRYLDEKRTSRA